MTEVQGSGVADITQQTAGGTGAATEPAWKQAFAPQANGTMTPVATKRYGRYDTVYNVRMKMHFSFFGLAALLYAVFYGICMHENDAGIAFGFFIVATICYFFEAMKRLELKVKKGTFFYLAAMGLLAVSTFCTDDSRIHLMNKTGIFLLTISLLLRQFYDTKGWGPGKYLAGMLCTVFGTFEELDQPFHDGAEAFRNGKGEKKLLGQVSLGVVLAIPLLTIVIGLLASADVFFAQLTTLRLDDMDTANGVGLILRILLMFFGTYTLFTCLCRQTISKEVKDSRTVEPATSITIAGLLTIVYLLFSGIQIFGLFLGRLQLPEEYTYSEYAREGFFQLLAVAVLNLVLVLAFLHYTRESRALRGVLAVMSACTYIMIASSAVRILMYIDAYKLTFSRIMVLWTLGLLAVLFAGVMIRIFRNGFPLFRYSVAAVTVLYLGLSFAHPDHLIAIENVKREKVDYWLLYSLSADAAPALVPYIQKEADRMAASDQDLMKSYVSRMLELKEGLDIRTFNVSRYAAVKVCEAYKRTAEEENTEAAAKDTEEETVVAAEQGQGILSPLFGREQVVLGSFKPEEE